MFICLSVGLSGFVSPYDIFSRMKLPSKENNVTNQKEMYERFLLNASWGKIEYFEG